MEKRIKIDISTRTIIKFLLLVVGLIFLYYIKNILVLLFIMVIIVAGLDPLVNWFIKLKIPQLLSVMLAYAILFGFLGLLIYLIIPPVIEQIKLLNTNFPSYIHKISNLNVDLGNIFMVSRDNLSNISTGLAKISGGIIDLVVVIFGGAASALTVLVLSFYLLLEKKPLKEFALSLLPQNKRIFVTNVFRKMLPKLGSWARGQVLLGLIVGLATYIILSIIGIPYALTLAIIAGIFEIVPIVGPIVAGLTAGLVAIATGSWWQVLVIAISYTALQQLESHLLVPKIMGKAVGLSPVIIIIALMVGAQLGGIGGAILAIPLAAVLVVFTQEYNKIREQL